MSDEAQVPDDPREAGGGMMGPGGPHDFRQVMFDTRRMVLVEQYEVAIAHTSSDGEPNEDNVAIIVRGRLNRPPDDAMAAEAPAEEIMHLHMLRWDLAAALIAELFALAGRAGFDEFVGMVSQAFEKLVEQNLTEQRKDEGDE